MRDFASHEELQRVFGACVRCEIDQAFVDNLGSRLSGDIAAKIDVEFARNQSSDLQRVGIRARSAKALAEFQPIPGRLRSCICVEAMNVAIYDSPLRGHPRRLRLAPKPTDE
jgi:hypothetical protein